MSDTFEAKYIFTVPPPIEYIPHLLFVKVVLSQNAVRIVKQK